MLSREQQGLNWLLQWFDPRGRSIGGLAFILNRITALGLVLYLYLHLYYLRQLAMGPQVWNAFIDSAENSLWIGIGELFVIAGGLIHGLNGLRIILNSFNIAVPYQKQLFYGLFTLALIGIAFFAVHMFGA